MLVTGEIVVRLRLVPSLQEDIAARGGGGRFGGILSKLRNVVLVLSYVLKALKGGTQVNVLTIPIVESLFWP
jgi:hypothetical protein